MILGRVVSGGTIARNRRVFTGTTSIVNVCSLDARVAVFVLESYVLEVDTRINDTKNHACSVVLIGESGSDGIGRERECVVDIRGFAHLVGEWRHSSGHADALHTADFSHVVDLVDRDVGRDESVLELALHLDAKCFEVVYRSVIVQTDER